MMHRQAGIAAVAGVILLAGIARVVVASVTALPDVPTSRRILESIDSQRVLPSTSSDLNIEAIASRSPFRPALTADGGAPQSPAADTAIQPIVHPVLLGTTSGGARETALLRWGNEPAQALGLKVTKNGYTVESIQKGRAILRHGDSLVTLTLRGVR